MWERSAARRQTIHAQRRLFLDMRGQSLVEFALLLPMLLIILLGVADFGRVFHAGITMEAAARAGAEAGAIEYLRRVADADPSYVLAPADYEAIRDVTVDVTCRAARLENADPPGCASGPAIRVCIHDTAGGDPSCGDGASAPIPGECWQVSEAMNPANALPVQPTDANAFPRGAYVEVRTCYRFTTLFNLNLSLPMNAGLSLGEIWLQRHATFTVADY